jgi:hypothetical protein
VYSTLQTGPNAASGGVHTTCGDREYQPFTAPIVVSAPNAATPYAMARNATSAPMLGASIRGRRLDDLRCVFV